MRIGCVGMATLDTLLFIPDQEMLDDDVAPVEEAIRCPGGKGMVTAAAVREQGGEVVPFALLGKEARLNGLLPRSLDRRYQLGLLERDSRTWITISHAQKVVTFVSRQGLLEGQEEVVAEALAGFFDEIDAVYVTVEDPIVLRAVLRLARSRGVPIALNASIPLLELLLGSDRDLLLGLLAESELIFSNHREGPRFLESLGLASWAAIPSDRGREVVVTEGEAGGQFSDGSARRWTRYEAVRPESVRCVVGAGDTFNGAYLVARWSSGLSAAESCSQGAALAARKVAVRASMLPTDQPTSAS